MKITTSWTKIIRASNIGRAYLLEHPEKTKLRYAIERSLSRIAVANDALQEALDAIDIEHAVTDKDGVLQMEVDMRTYRFTPAQKKARNIARTGLLNKENVEIEAYFATQVPDDISEDGLSAFEGIIIRSEDAERIWQARENTSDEVEA